MYATLEPNWKVPLGTSQRSYGYASRYSCQLMLLVPSLVPPKFPQQFLCDWSFFFFSVSVLQ